MFPSLILAAAIGGQIRSCQTAASYQRTYAAPTYAVRSYAPPYYYPKAQVETAFIANEVHYPTYSYLVGGAERALGRRREDQATVEALTASVGSLTAEVRGLAARIGQVPVPSPPVVVQPPPVAPAKPTPDVPTKPTPDVPEKPLPDAPPLPKTNPAVPDNGDVPPPPPVPSVPPPVPPSVPTPPTPNPSAGVPAPDANVLAILTKQCAKCHTAPAKAGKGLVLFSEPGKLANLGPLDLLMIDQEVYSGTMPKNGDPMSAEDYSRLRAWINQSQDAIETAIRSGKPK